MARTAITRSRRPRASAREAQPQASRRKRRARATPRLVESCAAILGRWRSSAFEFEASCRHGLRSGFCLAGESWARADVMAAEIVRESLHRIGARRPTWEEGQPEYTQQALRRSNGFSASIAASAFQTIAAGDATRRI